ncbi:unnamed protein product [Symbiodinium sp. CCMP2592]|nr:unnamed protein product [Symbiodinium sp. CCMP2592]
MKASGHSEAGGQRCEGDRRGALGGSPHEEASSQGLQKRLVWGSQGGRGARQELDHRATHGFSGGSAGSPCDRDALVESRSASAWSVLPEGL